MEKEEEDPLNGRKKPMVVKLNSEKKMILFKIFQIPLSFLV